jgi:hypothetical protein
MTDSSLDLIWIIIMNQLEYEKVNDSSYEMMENINEIYFLSEKKMLTERHVKSM